MTDAYLRLAITDTVMAAAGGCGPGEPLARITRMFWYRLPNHWLHNGELAASRRDHLLRHIYGPNWRTGVSEGGSYVVLDLQVWIPSPDEVRRRPWLADRAVCYAWRPDDVLEEIIPAKL